MSFIKIFNNVSARRKGAQSRPTAPPRFMNGTMRRIKDIFFLSLRIFKTRRTRSILTVLGISVGIGTILFLVSLGYGLQQILLERITTSEALQTLDVIASEPDLLPLSVGKLNAIKKLPHVTEISSLVNLPGQISFGALSGNVAINVIDDSYFRLSSIKLKEGVISKQANEVVITQAITKLLNVGVDESILGKQVSITAFLPQKQTAESALFGGEIEIKTFDHSFTIVGVLEEVNVGYLYLPAVNMREKPLPPPLQAKIKVAEPEFLGSVRNQIIEMGFLVSSLSDTVAQANKIFKGIQIVLAIFGIIALVISAIGMLNTMTVSLLEQTREIGIMKSLGASRGDIWVLFCSEATVIGFLGGAGGLVIGLFATRIFNFGVNILARALGGQPLDLFVTPVWFILFVIFFSTTIGFLTGLWPAKRAAGLKPLEALRY